MPMHMRGRGRTRSWPSRVRAEHVGPGLQDVARAREPIVALHQQREAAARHVAREIDPGLALRLEQPRGRMDQRIALLESDRVVQATQLVDLDEPGAEGA